MRKDIQALLDEIKEKKFSNLTDKQLQNIENLKSMQPTACKKGGYANIVNLNNLNKENGHFEKLRNSKIGKKRKDEHRELIRKGSMHSWRTISQFTKDGKWIKDWDNFTDIERECGFIKQPIWAVCNNKPKCKSAYGFIWKYKK